MTATERLHSPSPEDLTAFVDDALPDDVRAGIESHVRGCADCCSIINDLRGVSREMAQWNVEGAPVTLRAPRVRRAPGFTLPAFSWRPAFTVVSLGTVATTVLLVGSALRHSKPTPTLAREMPVSVRAADRISSVDGTLNGNIDGIGPLDKFGVGGGGGRGGRAAPTAAPVAPTSAAAALLNQPAMAAKTEAAPRQASLIRTATLRLVATDFNDARSRVEGIIAQDGGFLDQITVNAAPGAARTLTGSLRVPSARLADALSRLRQLGQVTEDTQGSEDVTDQVVDLDARLANARATEQRLNEILRNRTGKLSDVLEVEQEISRVRLDIEQMAAQQLNTSRRVTYSTITLEIDEIRRAGLESGPLSLTTRLRVAAADGLEAALDSIVGAVLFVLRAGPAALLWVGGASSVFLAWRKVRSSSRPRASE